MTGPFRGLVQPEGHEGILPVRGGHPLTPILSKAFLLAEDTKIKDPSILSQIGGR